MSGFNSLEKLKPSQEKIWEKHYPDGAKNFDFPKMTIYDLVYENNKNKKDNIALEYEGNSIRYGEFFDHVDEKTEFLSSKGISFGDFVTMSMLMSPEFVYDWYALSRLGAISNLVDPRTSSVGINDYLTEANSKYILSTNLFSFKMLQAMGKNSMYSLINYSLSDSADKMPLLLGTINGAVNLANRIISKFDSRVENFDKDKFNNLILDDTKLHGYEKDMPLSLVHTGGTTGSPKGALLSHDNYNAMAYEYLKSGIGFTEGDRFLLIMPGWIGYGSGMLHMSLVGGMTATIVSKLNSKKMGNYLLKYKPQWFAGVPVHYQIIRDSKILKDKDLSFIKGGAVGGDSMSIELFNSTNDFLLSHGASKGVFPGYSLTEQTSASAVRQNEDYVAGSVGIPLPGCVVGIFRYDMAEEKTTDIELDYDEEGEICWKSPNQMLGYFKNDDLTAEILKTHGDGSVWLHTGDLGHLNKDGILFVDGRIKDLITRSDGFKIYPKVIEKTIFVCKGVKDCKVVGVPDIRSSKGEIPVAFVVLENNDPDLIQKTLKQIKTVCKKCLPSYYMDGILFEVIDKMPRTLVGKISSQELKKESMERNKKRNK